MERQEHCTQFPNQVDTFLGHFNFPVCLWDMDPYSRVREKDTNYRNEMLSKTFGHLLQRSCYNWGSEEQNQASHWAKWRSPHHCEETQKRWYGHITRSTGLAKMILWGTVQGGRRRGRQKMRWEDNVTEWTGLKLGEALRKAENREEWRKVVARSSLVPQRSTKLRISEIKWHPFVQHVYTCPYLC